MTVKNVNSLKQFQDLISPYKIECDSFYFRESDFENEEEFVATLNTVYQHFRPLTINVLLRDYS